MNEFWLNGRQRSNAKKKRSVKASASQTANLHLSSLRSSNKRASLKRNVLSLCLYVAFTNVHKFQHLLILMGIFLSFYKSFRKCKEETYDAHSQRACIVPMSCVCMYMYMQSTYKFFRAQGFSISTNMQ